MKYLAWVVKGLEGIAQEEIKEILEDSLILEKDTKRIIFESEQEAKKILELKTVDGVVVLLGEMGSDNLQEIVEYVTGLSWPKEVGEFSITASVVGAKNFRAEEMVEAMAVALAKELEMKYLDKERAELDVRIMIDGKEVYVGYRLGQESLWKRRYKTEELPGSLRPSIAAGMLRFVRAKKDIKLVDNFCGSGTILAEAWGMGCQVWGGDINPQSVVATQKNLANLGFEGFSKIKKQDALKTSWPAKYFDLAVSNLPWGKQIKIESLTNLYAGSLAEYQRILKPTGSLCLLVEKEPEMLIKYAKKYFPKHKISSLEIGYLGSRVRMVRVCTNT